MPADTGHQCLCHRARTLEACPRRWMRRCEAATPGDAWRRPIMPGLTTVRERTFEVMRHHRMTRIFGNPGSTEIPFLTDLPAEFEFVLALHEGSVVGIASGYALATGAPAFVNLHTAPGLGHAGNAIAGARDSRAPLVIVVGQQDRAHSAMAPFLTGRDLDRLAGSYPVWTCTDRKTQAAPRICPVRSREPGTRPAPHAARHW